VNGIHAEIPYTAENWNISYDGQYVRYAASVGLSVTFDGHWSITVEVPTTLHAGKMCGLCGNNDNDANNDVIMANETFADGLPDASNIVGDSYVVYDSTETTKQYGCCLFMLAKHLIQVQSRVILHVCCQHMSLKQSFPSRLAYPFIIVAEHLKQKGPADRREWSTTAD
jgi:hypothetical protein